MHVDRIVISDKATLVEVARWQDPKMSLANKD
jgi:hypothetical protein